MREFLVTTPVVRLSVTSSESTVTRIRFGGTATLPPSGSFEEQVARELLEYFDGGRTEFTFPVEAAGPEFHQEVWQALSAIPYGETRTYGEIAKAVDVNKSTVGRWREKNYL